MMDYMDHNMLPMQTTNYHLLILNYNFAMANRNPDKPEPCIEDFVPGGKPKKRLMTLRG